MDLAKTYTSLTEKELFNILSNDEKWRQDAQEAARDELLRRKFSPAYIEQNISRRKTIIEKNRLRVSDHKEENAKIGYNLEEAAITLLTFPFSLIFPARILSEFARLEQYGYKRKFGQRIFLLIFSALVWAALIVCIV
jgi:hypothetical protein